MMRAVAIACLCSLAAAPACATDFKRAAKSGEKTFMANYRSWKADCSPNYGVVKVVTKPQHGTLSQQMVPSVIGKGRYQVNFDCSGKPIDALQVQYESEKGYHGDDTFQLQVSFGLRRSIIFLSM